MPGQHHAVVDLADDLQVARSDLADEPPGRGEHEIERTGQVGEQRRLEGNRERAPAVFDHQGPAHDLLAVGDPVRGQAGGVRELSLQVGEGGRKLTLIAGRFAYPVRGRPDTVENGQLAVPHGGVGDLRELPVQVPVGVDGQRHLQADGDVSGALQGRQVALDVRDRGNAGRA